LKVVADSNVLIRAAVGDNEHQARLARDALRHADEIAISLTVFCEFVWVLERRYRRSRLDVARGIRAMIDDRRVVYDRFAVAAGLAMMDAGGDFADGVIAFEGRRLGGDVFVTFDKQAAKLITAAGDAVDLLDAE
jgi:predicted nucleic-acid-binding protein